MSRLSAGVILCTRNRTVEVERFLSALAGQTRIVDEVLLIDGASNPRVKSIGEKFSGRFQRFSYLTTDRDLTSARNLGVQRSQSEVLFFLDDDLILERDFTESLMTVFESDEKKEIGGACGTIVNYRRPAGIRALINRVFFLPGAGNGRFKLSGAATWVYDQPGAKFVEFLPGGLTAYRREVFSTDLFDEELPAFGYTDDVDFSYRVSLRYKNYYAPGARAIHEHSSVPRPMPLNVLVRWIWAYWRTYWKNRRKDLAGYAPLCLLSLGYVLRFIESQTLARLAAQ